MIPGGAEAEAGNIVDFRKKNEKRDQTLCPKGLLGSKSNDPEGKIFPAG
jgi:hypothetical protein